VSNGEYYTDAEREALETKGLRKRAQTIREFLQLADQLGLEGEVVASGVEQLRDTGPKDLKQLRGAMANVSSFLLSLRSEAGTTEQEIPTVAAIQQEDALQNEAAVATQPEIPVHIPEAQHLPVFDVPTLAYDEKPVTVSPEIEKLTLPEYEDVPQSVVDALEEQLTDIGEVTGSVTEAGLFVLRRLTKSKDIELDSLQITDINHILTIISESTSSGKLGESTRNKLALLLSGVPKREIAGAESAVNNTYMSIGKVGKATALLQKLGIDTATSTTQEVTVPPVQKEVLKEELVDEIIHNGIHQPEIVSRDEWTTATTDRYEKLTDAAGFTDSQAEQLWDWIHFSDDTSDKTLGEGAKSALDTLQCRYLDKSQQEYFKSIPRQNVAMRCLLIRAMGVLPLEKIYEKMASVKSGESPLTKMLAERHIVAGVLQLLVKE
jgi:hypothetical protein